MQAKSFTKLCGEVDVDETYIGGKARNMHTSKRKRIGVDKRENPMAGKVAVMGLLERHGKGDSTIRGVRERREPAPWPEKGVPP